MGGDTVLGIPMEWADIEAQVTSFFSIPAVVPLLSAVLAVAVAVIVIEGVRSIFFRGWD